jgi:hypothetical protein
LFALTRWVRCRQSPEEARHGAGAPVLALIVTNGTEPCSGFVHLVRTPASPSEKASPRNRPNAVALSGWSTCCQPGRGAGSTSLWITSAPTRKPLENCRQESVDASTSIGRPPILHGSTWLNPILRLCNGLLCIIQTTELHSKLNKVSIEAQNISTKIRAHIDGRKYSIISVSSY